MRYKKKMPCYQVSLEQLLINYFRKVFSITFIGNIYFKKKLLEKLITLLFSHKIFLKIVSKPMPLRYLLTFPKKKKRRERFLNF